MKPDTHRLRVLAAVYGGTNYGFTEPQDDVIFKCIEAHPINGLNSHCMYMWRSTIAHIDMLVEEAESWLSRMEACPPDQFAKQFPRAAAISARYDAYVGERA